MRKQEILAKKLLELTNKMTKWNFQMKNSLDNYYIEAVMTSQKEGKIIITYEVRDWYMVLKVKAPDGKYDDDFVYEKLLELSGQIDIVAEYGIYSTVSGEKTGICLNSPMPLEVLEKEMPTVIRKLMPDMVIAMIEIICYED